MANNAPEAEAELAKFRQRWREEVSARNKRPVGNGKRSRDETKEGRRTGLPKYSSSTAAGPSSTKGVTHDYSEELEPGSYHDLPNKEEHLKLANAGQNHDRLLFAEPSSPLEHYERAVELETQGRLGESIKHYRTAFKLDQDVHETYKKKHFPPSAFSNPKPSNPNPSNASVTLPNTAHHSLHGGSDLPATLKQLMDEFSGLSIESPPPQTDASPPGRSFLGELPEEILTQILSDVATFDVAAFARMALVCKRLAYLVMTEESIWKSMAFGESNGFAGMHYKFACDVGGFPLDANDEIARYLDSYREDPSIELQEATIEPSTSAFTTIAQQLLYSTYAGSWRQMFRSRPRIRFNGCYISTVNYTRPGGSSTNTLSWGAPVHVVTYFRYLRFFRDGTVISLLTTHEPVDVVHHLTKENLHDHHGNVLPSSVMKDALRGRWRLSGPLSDVVNPSTGEKEAEGDVFLETEGATSKYVYKLQLALAHAGKGARNNKLAWKGYWSHHRLTDDLAAFGLKNDKAYYWSRVKSFA